MNYFHIEFGGNFILHRFSMNKLKIRLFVVHGITQPNLSNPQ